MGNINLYGIRFTEDGKSQSGSHRFKVFVGRKEDQVLINEINAMKGVVGLYPAYPAHFPYEYMLYINKNAHLRETLKHVFNTIFGYVKRKQGAGADWIGQHFIEDIEEAMVDEKTLIDADEVAKKAVPTGVGHTAVILKEGSSCEEYIEKKLPIENMRQESAVLVANCSIRNGRVKSLPHGPGGKDLYSALPKEHRQVVKTAESFKRTAEVFLAQEGMANVGFTLLVSCHSKYAGENGVVKLMEDYAKWKNGHDRDVEVGKLLFQTLYRENDEIADEFVKVANMLLDGSMFTQDSPALKRFEMCINRMRTVGREEADV